MKKNNNTEKAALDAIKISEALKKGTEKNLQSLINEAISNAINEPEDDEDSEDGESLASEKDTDANFEDTDVTPDNDEMGGEMDDEESEDADDEWSDFDDLKVGDIVPVNISYGNLNINADVKVVSATDRRAGAEFVNLDQITANKLLYMNLLLEEQAAARSHSNDISYIK